MSESKPRLYGASRKGKPNRNSSTVRLSLASMKFDAVAEWVKAFKELEDPNQKLERLEKLMRFVFPTLKEVDTESYKIIELEAMDNQIDMIPAAEASTDQLLEALKDGSGEDKE